MVEKIIINPEEVRGYGNICEEHSLEDFIVSSSALAKEKETVHGALTNVYKLVYSLYGLMFYFDKGNKQLYLQMAEADILSFGFDTTNKQLYLVDVDDTGFNLGFDEDTNELYITDDAPPIVHNYSLAFRSSSYVATGGSATLEMTLLDNSVPVEGATISVSGSDGSLYTGITDNTGLATVTVTGISGTVTFTCTYSNVSDTCTVTGSSYLFYDECTSADGLSNYGNSVYVKNTNSTLTLSYDSTMNAYKVVGNDTDGYAKIPIPALDGKDGFFIEAEFFSSYNNTKHQSGICIYDTNSSAGNAIWARDISNMNRCGWLESANGSDTNEAGNAQKSNLPVYNNWYKLRFEINGTTATAKWMKTDDTLIYSYSYTIPSYNSNSVGLQFLAWSNPYYVRNIKAEAL